ncbi:MAG: hypothetical protein MUF31_09580 [Akkermansiaceae bacterium]|jgi:tetratricopeptide (TPR) repeat protein|nr:hypothetical protein [Akkermansiaceae bacterium]
MMKKLLFLFALVAPLQAQQANPPLATIQISSERIEQSIREAAVKIRDVLGDKYPEADQIVDRVDELFAMPDVEQKDSSGDRVAQMVDSLVLFKSGFNLSATLDGITGHEFDTSRPSGMQLYRELEGQKARDEAEIRRWLRMYQAANRFDDENRQDFCLRKAIREARNLVSQETQNAEAHALLAYALDLQNRGSSEAIEVAQQALKIDPRQILAHTVILELKIDNAFDVAVFRKPMKLGDEDPEDTTRELYDNPLNEEELAAFKEATVLLEKEARKIIQLAEEQKDFAGFMMATRALRSTREYVKKATISQDRPLNQSFEEFFLMLYMASYFGVNHFESEAQTAKAVELAGDDAEAIGSIIVSILTYDVMISSAQNKKSTLVDSEMIADFENKLVKLSRSDHAVTAARACEALTAIEWFRVISGRSMKNPEILLRAIQLNPFRYHNFTVLSGYSWIVKKEPLNTVAALCEIQLALLPNLETRRQAAAVAARMQDWETAQRHLNSAVKEMPRDLGLLSQRVATLLRRSTDENTIKEAALLYGDITPDNVMDRTVDLEESERENFIHNHAIFLILSQRRVDAEKLIQASLDVSIFDEKEAEALRGFMR